MEQIPRRNNTLLQALRELKGTLQAANRIVPGCVVVGLILSATVVFVTTSSLQWMIGLVVLLVLFFSFLIYASTQNYGESALALVAGLLTAYTVDWTVGKFTAFVFAWAGLSLGALLLSSVRIAAKVEEIIVDAANVIGDGDRKELRKRLEAISKKAETKMLGPVERAELIRLFAFRRLPIESMVYALRATEVMTVITGANHDIVGAFVIDVYKIFKSDPGPRFNNLLDRIYAHMRASSVSPSEFIEAFRDSRFVALSSDNSPEEYFHKLIEALSRGVSPNEIGEYLRNAEEDD